MVLRNEPAVNVVRTPREKMCQLKSCAVVLVAAAVCLFAVLFVYLVFDMAQFLSQV